MENIYTEILGEDNVSVICKEFDLKEEETKKVSMALSMYDRFYNYKGEDDLTDDEIADIILSRIGNDEDGRIIDACVEIMTESYVFDEMKDLDDSEIIVH